MQVTAASSSAYTYRIASVSALGGLLLGFDTPIINGAIVFLKPQFGRTEFQTEIAASSLLGRCILGASIAGWLSDYYGRMRVLLHSAAIFAVSSLVTAIANGILTLRPSLAVFGAQLLEFTHPHPDPLLRRMFLAGHGPRRMGRHIGIVPHPSEAKGDVGSYY